MSQATPRPFEQVFSGKVKGDLVMAANSNLLESAAWTDDDDRTPADIDGDADELCLSRSIGGELCRDNSSSALLNLPDNARVIDARLYIQTTLNPNVEGIKVNVAGPEDGFNYTTIPDSSIPKIYEASVGGAPGNYPYDNMRSASFDVTNLVQQQGGGDYTVADIVYEGEGLTWTPYAGWALMVAYEWDDSSDTNFDSLSDAEKYRFKLRSLSWSDGLLYQIDGSTSVVLDNIEVPKSGPKFGKSFHLVSHAQRGWDDALDFNGQLLGDNNAESNSPNPYEVIGDDPECNTTTDVQNETICYLGSHVDTKNPGADAYKVSRDDTTLSSSTSVDADVIRIPDSYLTEDLTSATLAVRTIENEWLTPAMLAMSIDLPEPKANIVKTVSPVSSSPIKPGDVFTYTITVENTHETETLSSLGFVDNLSDVIDDATLNDDLTASLGVASLDSSSTIEWNGSLDPGQIATITYSVTVDNPANGNGLLTNGVVSFGQSNCTEDPATHEDCLTVTPLGNGRLAETGHGVLPFVIAAAISIAGGFAMTRWRQSFTRVDRAPR